MKLLRLLKKKTRI